MSLLAALVFLCTPAPTQTTLEFTPTEDVWVYPHAADPEKDEYLRVWGVDGLPVAKSPGDLDSFSYSYLQFKLEGVPRNKDLVEAKLMVIQIPDPAYSLEAARAAPIEARPLPEFFTEKGWSYELARKNSPDAKAMYGAGAPDHWAAGKAVPISIDLLKGSADFGKAVRAAAASNGSLALALTSKLDATERAVYKIYSRNGSEAHRPKLRLVFADSRG